MGGTREGRGDEGPAAVPSRHTRTHEPSPCLTLTAKRSHISGARYICVVVFSIISSCVERSLEFATD